MKILTVLKKNIYIYIYIYKFKKIKKFKIPSKFESEDYPWFNYLIKVI